MDYRYETKNEARDFHKQRKAFIILDNKLEFLPENSSMSHFEYCQIKGLNKEQFNQITRGYYLNENVVFYKDNFIYDEELIKKSLIYLEEISQKINKKDFEIYFGQIPEENFALDYKKFKSVFEQSPSIEKINYTLAVLTSRKIDNGNSIKYCGQYYQPYLNNELKCFRQKTDCLVIKAFNGDLLVTIDEQVLELKELSRNEKFSKNFDEIIEVKEKKKYIPPMSHP